MDVYNSLGVYWVQSGAKCGTLLAFEEPVKYGLETGVRGLEHPATSRGAAKARVPVPQWGKVLGVLAIGTGTLRCVI